MFSEPGRPGRWGWIGGKSGSLLLQRQFAVVPVSPGGEESSNFGLKIFHWLPQADLEGDHHLGVVHLDNIHVDNEVDVRVFL